MAWHSSKGRPVKPQDPSIVSMELIQSPVYVRLIRGCSKSKKKAIAAPTSHWHERGGVSGRATASSAISQIAVRPHGYCGCSDDSAYMIPDMTRAVTGQVGKTTISRLMSTHTIGLYKLVAMNTISATGKEHAIAEHAILVQNEGPKQHLRSAVSCNAGQLIRKAGSRRRQLLRSLTVSCLRSIDALAIAAEELFGTVRLHSGTLFCVSRGRVQRHPAATPCILCSLTLEVL